MTLGDIRNTPLRRAALIVLFVPILLASWAWAVWGITRQLAQEVPDAVRDVWRWR